MNNHFTFISRPARYFFIALIFPLLAILHSCKEDTGSVGANVLPKSDLISAYQADTFSLLTSMFLKDSVPTNSTQNSPLGSYNDPIFGQVKGSLYLQVSSNGGSTVPWADSGTVDSVYLNLSLQSTYYGNLDPQTFVVDTVSAVFHSGKEYWSDTNLKYSPSPIAIQQVTPNLASDTLKIKLSKNWVNYIVSKINANSNYYTSFDSLVRGLYVTVSNPLQLPGQGGLLYINGASTSAGIYFYYHFNLTPATAYSVYIPTGGLGLYFSNYEHNYSTAAFYTAHPSGKHDSIGGNDLVYVQSLGGVCGRINFPNLSKNWAKLRPVLINEAEVDVSVDAQDLSPSFAPPSQLYLYGTSPSWGLYGIPDENGYGYFGGTYDGFNNTYTFVITQYIQGVIDGKDTDRGLYIVPAYEYTTANRVVLYGAKHDELPSTKAMKLKIYYTPLKP
jgi:hypothetical protein